MRLFARRMPTDGTGGPGLAVVAGDVLALRGTGLAAAETWALLCQAAQALQDLFLSSKLQIVYFIARILHRSFSVFAAMKGLRAIL